MVTTRPPKTIVKPTALGPVANTDTKLLVYGLFQKGRVLAQDGVVVQKTKQGEVNWIIETKGRVWEGTAAKDDALETWCGRVSAATGTSWRYVRVNQASFHVDRHTTLQEVIARQ